MKSFVLYLFGLFLGSLICSFVLRFVNYWLVKQIPNYFGFKPLNVTTHTRNHGNDPLGRFACIWASSRPLTLLLLSLPLPPSHCTCVRMCRVWVKKVWDKQSVCFLSLSSSLHLCLRSASLCVCAWMSMCQNMERIRFRSVWSEKKHAPNTEAWASCQVANNNRVWYIMTNKNKSRNKNGERESTRMRQRENNKKNNNQYEEHKTFVYTQYLPIRKR